MCIQQLGEVQNAPVHPWNEQCLAKGVALNICVECVCPINTHFLISPVKTTSFKLDDVVHAIEIDIVHQTSIYFKINLVKFLYVFGGKKFVCCMTQIIACNLTADICMG